MVVVHLADQGVAQVHGDALDRLVLPRGVEDAEQELVDTAVLELQLLGDAEVAEGQAAVPLDLGRDGDKWSGVRGGLEGLLREHPGLSCLGRLSGKETTRLLKKLFKKNVKCSIQKSG